MDKQRKSRNVLPSHGTASEKNWQAAGIKNKKQKPRRSPYAEKYDFKGGRRGGVLPAGENKVRITIRLDRDILEWFRSQVEERGGGNYQTLINQALRESIAREDRPLEDVLRRVVREELQNVRTP